MEAKEKAAVSEEKAKVERISHRTSSHEPGHGKDTAERAERAGEAARPRLVDSLKAGGQVESEIVGLVRNAVSDTLQATGSVAAETVEVARTVVSGAIQAGEAVGTDAGRAMKRAVDGIAAGVLDSGGNVGRVLVQGLNGTLVVAGSVGLGTVRIAKDILVGVVGGAKEVLGTALPQERSHARSGPHAA